MGNFPHPQNPQSISISSSLHTSSLLDAGLPACALPGQQCPFHLQFATSQAFLGFLPSSPSAPGQICGKNSQELHHPLKSLLKTFVFARKAAINKCRKEYSSEHWEQQTPSWFLSPLLTPSPASCCPALLIINFLGKEPLSPISGCTRPGPVVLSGAQDKI